MITHLLFLCFKKHLNKMLLKIDFLVIIYYYDHVLYLDCVLLHANFKFDTLLHVGLGTSLLHK